MHPNYSPVSLYRNRMRMPMRAQVELLEREIQKLPQADCPLWHFFAPGLYARKMLIPKGVALTGAVHKTEHLCIVSGDLEVTTDDGVSRITSPQSIFTSKPGAKRAGYAHEDTFFTTVHATTETDLDKLVIELTESTSAELIGGRDNVQLRVSAERDNHGMKPIGDQS
jgi:hypothetical protein